MSVWRPTKESKRLIHEQRQQFDDFRRKSLGDVDSCDLDAIQTIMLEEEEQYTSRLREAAEVSKVDEEAIQRIRAEEDRAINVERNQEEESMMLVRQIMRQEFMEMQEEDPASVAAAVPSVAAAAAPSPESKSRISDMEAVKRKELEALSRRSSSAALKATEAGFMTAEDCKAIIAALEGDMAEFEDVVVEDDDDDHDHQTPRKSLDKTCVCMPRNELYESSSSDDENDCSDVASTIAPMNESSDVLPYETCIDISNTLGDVRLENWQQIAEIEIGRLPVEMYDPNEEPKKSNHPCETICMICQCSYEEDDILRRLPCNHCFHVTCVDEWLMKQDTCPCCRKHIT